MFARVKKSGKYQYLQIVENKKEKGKVRQYIVATVDRMDELGAKGRIETLIRSLSRFSERTMLVLSGSSEVMADAKKIGPPLIFDRLWERTGAIFLPSWIWCSLTQRRSILKAKADKLSVVEGSARTIVRT